jgi:UDP-N-acetylmuramoyl-L-alanyl-D-glutamate--2,6-diaminopimelate ligase
MKKIKGFLKKFLPPQLILFYHCFSSFLAGVYYGFPSRKIILVGVTGTNGKTTTATLLYHLFKKLGYKAGLISTVRNRIDETEVPAIRTTPDGFALNSLLSRMVRKGCRFCFMEVSSHAVAQHRIKGIKFAGGIFTNITHDHLDYHKTFEEYFKAKQRFFNSLGSASFVLVNSDDPNGRRMVEKSRARKFYYALEKEADFCSRVIRNQLSGLVLTIDGEEIETKFVGGFNAYNLLAVYGTAVLLGEDKTRIREALKGLEPVEGRFQYFKSRSGIVGIVDYAHTPDALAKVLKTIRDIKKTNGRVITVVGCGGDRDAAKRPLMAKIACEFSDAVILTSDNPRREDPLAIVKEMEKGVEPACVTKTRSIVNRKEAIETACGLAKPGHIILLAGKGHENYQEINGVRFHFDDREELKRCLESL